MNITKRKSFVLLATMFLFSFIAMLLLPLLSAPARAVDLGEGMSVVYLALPDDWEHPHVWAWDDEGVNAFAAWPGEEAEADPDNEGWYFIHMPLSMTNIIVSASDGDFQTEDHQITDFPVWITVISKDEIEISYEAQTEGELPLFVRRYTIHARVPADWETVNIWAWLAPEGTNAFPAWPGAEMREGSGGWHTARVPYWVNSIIINGNEGAVQTEDLDIEAAELWIAVADDLTAEISTDNPDLRVENITVRAQVPADWDTPNLWAWTHPEGTNVFATWPGEPLVLVDGWYTMEVPGWVNSVIINANDGEIQTGDMRITEGLDIWILVEDADTYFHGYTEIAGAPTPEPTQTPEPKPAPQDEDTGLSGGVIALIVLAAIAVIVVIVVVVKKRSS